MSQPIGRLTTQRKGRRDGRANGPWCAAACEWLWRQKDVAKEEKKSKQSKESKVRVRRNGLYRWQNVQANVSNVKARFYYTLRYVLFITF